jgi:type I restriction enzyme R subunit
VTTFPDEYTEVERPLIDQLQALGWQYLAGDTDVPELTERRSFREVLLLGRLHAAIRRLNVDEDGLPWLDDGRVFAAAGELERLGAPKLLEANQLATELLLKGTAVEGDALRHDGKEQTARFIDFVRPERNDFLVVNQFRVDGPGGQRTIIPDLVLFVNGIPLVVIEAKSPAATDPIEAGITQLLRYTNRRGWVTAEEGAEQLFHYNQFLVATCFHQAHVGTIGASYEHYLEWKDTSPVPMAQVAQELGVDHLSSQQTLVAGMLRPAHLLDIVRNFTLFSQAGGKTVKIVARYQQFRAVQEAVRRLLHGQTKAQHGLEDQRGGIIWHTQGSGKSLTMVFLIRKMRTVPGLRRFKVVIVTDRTDLEQQLSGTATLTNETVRRARSATDLQTILREDGPDLVFATIQKYRAPDDEVTVLELERRPAEGQMREVAETPGEYATGGQVLRLPAAEPDYPLLNESTEILVLVDEAHRSQNNTLHAGLLHALPNCARIGFTGTPILMGDAKKTRDIFGDFIDRYTIQQSEADGATVAIRYEGRTAPGTVVDGQSLDQLFEDMFRERTPNEIEAIKRKYATAGDVLEAPKLIAAKAANMLRHYVDTVLPNGLKAQVVATSRLAAVRYQAALLKARNEIVAAVERLDLALLTLPDDELLRYDAETQFLVRAHAHLDLLRRLEFGVVISAGSHNDDPAWHTWTDKGLTDARIARFKRPLGASRSEQQDPLAFLCVKSMLLTGFDAPVEQVIYLDRFMQSHELLQAIARVNRPAANKSHGLVVDYFGIAWHLKEALAAYSADEVQGALTRLDDELPQLRDRHQRVVQVFRDRGLAGLEPVNPCIDLLRDLRGRAEFVVKLKQFLESLDIVLPRPEALPYIRDARLLGYINKSAANLYRDEQLNLVGAEPKVRALIDQYIVAQGIDPKIPPISILDANFAGVVEAHTSNRARASEMEFAARHHIDSHFAEDPAYYRKLSERLAAILQQFADNWEELVAALRRFSDEVRSGPEPATNGLDARTQAPFLRLLLDEQMLPVGSVPTTLAALAALTVEMVEHIRQEIALVDFWRSVHAQQVLRGWLVQFLDTRTYIPFARQQAVADQLVDLARALHTRLLA